MLLSNYLAVLMKPTYEKPIDTVGDALGEHRLDFLLNPSVKGCQFHRNVDEKHFLIISLLDSGKGIVYVPGGQYIQQQLATASDIRLREISSRWVDLADDGSDFYEILETVITDNDKIHLSNYLNGKVKSFGSWYKSSERLE